MPSYVPSNGLVTYWPFNGNADDASVNGNNGIVNGATLTTDRNGAIDKAYLFDGNSKIFNNNDVLRKLIDNNNSFSVSLWFNKTYNSNTSLDGYNQMVLFAFDGNNISPYKRVWTCLGQQNDNETYIEFRRTNNNTNVSGTIATANDIFVVNGSWHNLVIVFDGSGKQFTYLDGKLCINFWAPGDVFGNLSENDNSVIGFTIGANNQANRTRFQGSLDDIGIWNRALTANEITALYQGCSKPTVTPLTAAIKTGENVTFTTPANANATFQWQTNPANVGWQNLSDNTTYSGTTTNALTLTNGQAHNNGQSFRVTANATGYNETSEPVTVAISDVCTNYTTVTDLLVINVGTLSTNTPNYKSTITIYPNPAKDHITIDCGTLANVTGYQIKIVNTLGQEVYKTSLNQQQFTIPLNSWTGKGLYFVSLYDNNNVLITTRKIELQ